MLFISCSEKIETVISGDSNYHHIGMPCSVSDMHIDVVGSRGVSESSVVPIHSSLCADGKIYCRFTSVPVIDVSNKSLDYSRAVALKQGDFHDSYSLYSYIYPSGSSFETLASAGSTTLVPIYSNEEVNRAKGWLTNEFWPGSSKRCSFFAYAPYKPVGVDPANFMLAGWPSFHYSVPVDVLEQTDLLVSKNENWNSLYGSSGNPGIDYANINVPGNYYEIDSIHFAHACTAIRFAIGDKMAPGVIKKIELINVYGDGDYWYKDEKWHNVNTTKSFLLTQDFEIKKGEKNKLLNYSDNVFMMIPQITPSNAAAVITIDDGEPHTIIANIANDVWQKGHTVTYYLSTEKDDSEFVLALAPSNDVLPFEGGQKKLYINSYKQSYYGTRKAVPWELEFTYEDDNMGLSAVQKDVSVVVPSIDFSGDGSTTGEINEMEIMGAYIRSRSWRSSHTAVLRNASVKGSVASPYDLSTGKQTANCYVVSAPGHYKLPLVYGNALNADGSSNSDSYGTATFVDHKGVQIDNPYIYQTNGGANVPYDACLVWQDAPQLIAPSSIRLTDDKRYIEFEIEKKNICQGNSIVAVRDVDGNIMWSWHIWVTDHDMTQTIPVNSHPTVTTQITSQFMRVPLGWCDAETRVYDKRTFHIKVLQTEPGGKTATCDFEQGDSDSLYVYGGNAPYYEWGRKDPMLAANGLSTNVDKPHYYEYYKWECIKDIVDVKVAIQNPHVFYFTAGKCWTKTHKLEFWNKGNTLSTLNNNPVHKTIYDPCPSGYNLPSNGAFTLITSTGNYTNVQSQYNVSGGWNNGYHMFTEGWQSGQTMYLPALGYRDNASDTGIGGKLVEVNLSLWYFVSGCCTSEKTIYGADIGAYPSRIMPYKAETCSYGINILPVLQ